MKQRRNTKQRKLVLDAVQVRQDHPSADSIYLDVRRRDDKVSRGTVYRNLKLLAEKGEITHVKVPATDRFDLRTDQYYHLFCVGCGAVFDAPIPYNETHDKEAAAESGFQIQRHRTFFEGLCSACQGQCVQEEKES